MMKVGKIVHHDETRISVEFAFNQEQADKLWQIPGAG
jgi:hypothetical protein